MGTHQNIMSGFHIVMLPMSRLRKSISKQCSMAAQDKVCMKIKNRGYIGGTLHERIDIS